MAQCMRWGVEDFCPDIQDTLKTDYLDLAEQRYCESADQYKEDVVEGTESKFYVTFSHITWVFCYLPGFTFSIYTVAVVC